MSARVYIDGQAGTTGLQIYDRLKARADIELLTVDPDRRKDPKARQACMAAADLTFFCLPDDAAREAAALAEGLNTRIIDASTAHRTHPDWVYGLAELHGRRQAIAAAKRVANPGCYATGTIALLRPLIQAGLLSPDASLAVHALSGYTGGGNKTIAQYAASDRPSTLDSPRHYALDLSHKHLPEMAQQSGLTRPPIFCPIICDFPQGMLVAIPLDGLDPQPLRDCYADYYRAERLIRLVPPPADGFLPSNAKAGWDDLTITVCGRQGRSVVYAQLDNLGKGAAGAAVQNMNLMLGLEEYTGLSIAN